MSCCGEVGDSNGPVLLFEVQGGDGEEVSLSTPESESLDSDRFCISLSSLSVVAWATFSRAISMTISMRQRCNHKLWFGRYKTDC